MDLEDGVDQLIEEEDAREALEDFTTLEGLVMMKHQMELKMVR